MDDLWVVISRAGQVLEVYDHEAQARRYMQSQAAPHGSGAVRVSPRHAQYERLAQHETGFVLEGYEPEPA